MQQKVKSSLRSNMKYKYYLFLKWLLRRNMEENRLAPSERLKVDGEKHEFEIQQKDRILKATYIAEFENFGEKNLILNSSYGLIDAQRHIFTKHLQEFMRK